MRQVPVYLIIGRGRLARHFHHYLQLLSQSVYQWDRSQSPETLKEYLSYVSHVLVLINDDQIVPFIQANLLGTAARLIHCSGSLVTPLAHGVHPLMTFSDTLYSKEEYEAIPFVMETEAPDFDVLMPGLPNDHLRLSPDKKAKYHALCVMSGNFSCLLWQKMMSSFETELSFPAKMVYPYLKRQMQNLMTDYKTVLTGPLSRGDRQTINHHLTALTNDPFKSIYQAFVDCYEGMANENT